jgi:hypothetical protein
MDYGTQVCMVFNSSYVRKTLKTPNCLIPYWYSSCEWPGQKCKRYRYASRLVP